MLHTIELITGIRPMTQFDALSIPMFNSFTSRPGLAPYTAIKPAGAILTQVNPANAPLATQVARQNFSREDLANMQLLNEAIWQSVKGAGNAMPPAQHHMIAPAAYQGEG